MSAGDLVKVEERRSDDGEGKGRGGAGGKVKGEKRHDGGEVRL